MTDRIYLLLERIFGKRAYCPACGKRTILNTAAGDWICCFRSSVSGEGDYADYWHKQCFEHDYGLVADRYGEWVQGYVETKR